MKSKKKVNTCADVLFSGPKPSEEQKKGHHALRLSFICISPLHHESFVNLSAGNAPGYAPEIVYKVKSFERIIKNEYIYKVSSMALRLVSGPILKKSNNMDR